MKKTKGQNIGLDETQKKFVQDHCMRLSDGRIAKRIKATRGTIQYYRSSVLGIEKNRASDIMRIKVPISLQDIREEIKALQQFACNYPSFRNGAHCRMRYLMTLVEGVMVSYS